MIAAAFSPQRTPTPLGLNIIIFYHTRLNASQVYSAKLQTKNGLRKKSAAQWELVGVLMGVGGIMGILWELLGVSGSFWGAFPACPRLRDGNVGNTRHAQEPPHRSKHQTA